MSQGYIPTYWSLCCFYQKLIDNEYKWVLFNDEKVVVCDDANLQDIKNNAYVYVFRKVE